MKLKNRGILIMEELRKRFPKICNCPHHNDIDRDLKSGKTPYYIANWLEKTECKISDTTIRRYQKYCFDNGILTLESTIRSPSENEEHLLTKLEKKAQKAIDNLDMDNLSDNVKVQFILGAYKILYGSKHQVDMAGDLRTESATVHDIDGDTLKVLSDAIQRRNNH